MLSNALLLTALAGASYDYDTTLNAYRLTESDGVPTIDGILDDDLWQHVSVMSDFHQVEPIEYAPPSFATHVQVAYDDETLYVSARLIDEPDQIVARQYLQNSGYDFDDQFHFIIDTFAQGRSGYFFQLNANGIRRDALITNDSFDEDWDSIWLGDAKIDESGWTIEMAIPMKSLAFDPSLDHWGINFGRVIQRLGETQAWASKGSSGWELAPAVAGRLTGLHGLQQGVGLDVVTSGLIRAESEPGFSDTDFEPSLDVFYKPTPSLTVAATINTDFSATEIDDRVVNLTRFSVFLPEKRDFFLQDTNIFDFADINGNGLPFFSRRIGLAPDGTPVPIDYGLKVTGRTERFSYGVLSVQQGDDQTQNVAVARAQANVLDESTAGFILTNGDPLRGGDNTLVGADFNYRNNEFVGDKLLLASTWWQRSDDSRDGIDDAWGASFEYPGRTLTTGASVIQIGERFFPALGFVNRRGIRRYQAQLGLTLRFDEQWVNRSYPWSRYFRTEDLDGRMLSEQWQLWPLSFTSVKDDHIEVYWFDNTEVFDQPFEISPGIVVPTGRYHEQRHGVRVWSGEQRPVSFDVNISRGGFLGGSSDDINLTANWHVNQRLFLSAGWFRSDIELPDGDFVARLYRIKADLAITPKLAWLNNAQFDNQSSQLGINSRLRWIPKPGNEFYLIYNENMDREDDRFRSTRRETVLKAAWTWRF